MPPPQHATNQMVVRHARRARIMDRSLGAAIERATGGLIDVDLYFAPHEIVGKGASGRETARSGRDRLYRHVQVADGERHCHNKEDNERALGVQAPPSAVRRFRPQPASRRVLRLDIDVRTRSPNKAAPIAGILACERGWQEPAGHRATDDLAALMGTTTASPVCDATICTGGEPPFLSIPKYIVRCGNGISIPR